MLEKKHFKKPEQKHYKDQNGKKMKNIYINLSIIFLNLLLGGCSSRNEIDCLISSKWEKCRNRDNCIIDFSTEMNFEWDKMYYFSSANSLEEMNQILGMELKSFTDIGDRIVFVNGNKVVYHQEWFYNSSRRSKGTVFSTDEDFFEVSKEQSKFKIKKREALYHLEPF
jgi:hypothetical protein